MLPGLNSTSALRQENSAASVCRLLNLSTSSSNILTEVSFAASLRFFISLTFWSVVKALALIWNVMQC